MEPAKRKAGSHLEETLARGRFAVTAEIGPPAAADATEVQRLARLLRGWTDACNVTDNNRALVRMASWAAAVVCLREGVEPVMQLTTRDRNRMALQADLLGAAAVGVRNVLCLRGDDPSHGNEPDAKAVHDLSPEELIGAIRRLRDEGKLAGGDEVKSRPAYFVGSTANPFLGPFEKGVEILQRRVAAGTDFFQTQAVYDVEAFAGYMAQARAAGVTGTTPILAGIVPLKSAKMARYMREKVPGITMPDSVVERMERASDAKGEGIAHALELIEALRKIPGVSGVHIMAVAWEKAVPEIVERAGLGPRESLVA